MMEITAGGMLRANTPIQDFRKKYGLWVKREDMSCVAPGPKFSKTRGVYARVKSRPEKLIGVLDTSHSQAGHAVARACEILGKKCLNFYPVYKHHWELRDPQVRSQELGAELVGIPAGRSCILFHNARKQTEERGGYMMPNALKLIESVDETAKEVPTRFHGWKSPDYVIIPSSSATIAAGVVKGFGLRTEYIIHLGYSRSHDEVRDYVAKMSGVSGAKLTIIDEGYQYKDQATAGDDPPWPSNPFYDLKAFRWWMRVGRKEYEGDVLFWNVG